MTESGTEATPADQDTDAVLNINIPYFGIARVARQSVRMAKCGLQPTNTTTDRGNQSQANHSSTSAHVLCVEGLEKSLSGLPATGADSTDRGTTLYYTSIGNDRNVRAVAQACMTTESYPGISPTDSNVLPPPFVLSPHNDVLGPLLRYEDHPGILLGVNIGPSKAWIWLSSTVS